MAEDLLASLDPHASDVELACKLETRKRVAEVEQGLVELVRSKAAFAKVRSILSA